MPVDSENKLWLHHLPSDYGLKNWKSYPHFFDLKDTQTRSKCRIWDEKAVSKSSVLSRFTGRGIWAPPLCKAGCSRLCLGNGQLPILSGLNNKDVFLLSRPSMVWNKSRGSRLDHSPGPGWQRSHYFEWRHYAYSCKRWWLHLPNYINILIWSLVNSQCTSYLTL